MLGTDADKANTQNESFGSIAHKGVYGCGHYISYIRINCGDKWFKFDDKKATIVSQFNAIDDIFGSNQSSEHTREGSACLLFYIRKNKKKYF